MIKVNIYPVGAIFSGGNQYSLDATNKIPSSSEKIYGYSKILNFNQNLNEDQWTIKINFDASELFQDCETSLGYGKYRIDFYSGPDQDNFLFIDYCIIDYSDANYGTSAFQGEQKIRIDFRPADQITFNFLSSSTPHNITAVEKNIRVWEQYGSGYPPTAPSRGAFNDTTLSQYQNFPIDAKQFGAIEHPNPGDFALNMDVKYQGANLKQNQKLNFDKCELTIKENIVFPANQTSEMNFSGKGAKFAAKNNSVINALSGFIINLNDSADIQLDGIKISTNSPSVIWRGIKANDLNVNSYIRNSNLEYADTALTVVNQLSRPFQFTSNTVLMSRTIPGYRYGLVFNNAVNLLINQNEFHIPPVHADPLYREGSIHITNYVNLPPGSRSLINVVDNKFYNGYYQLNLLGYTSNLVTVYVAQNSFYNSNHNLIGRKCIGDVKNNEFSNNIPIPPWDLRSQNVVTNYANLNFYSNTFQSIQYNIFMANNSFPNLAPLRDVYNNLIWVAGLNSLSNDNYDNLVVTGNGYVFTNLGKNSFTLGNPNYRHIYAEILDTSSFYFANDNCWYGSGDTAKLEIRKIGPGGDLVEYQAIPSDNCLIGTLASEYLSIDKNYGIQDTIFISQSSVNQSASEAEMLFAESIKNIAAIDYTSAIQNLKQIISIHNSSDYSNSSVQKLYELHCTLDTSGSQTNTNQLFTTLKQFLETVTLLNASNEKFVKISCETILMCEVKLKNYNSAMSGYEYISLNDPDYNSRLSAALDYLGIMCIVNGGAGGSFAKVKRDLPVNRMLKKIYSINKVSHTGNSKDKEQKVILDGKIKEVMTKSKTLIKDEKVKLLESETLNSFGNESEFNHTNVIKTVINSTNYPNPFNPATVIKFELPESGITDLKVYDISGKQIQHLIKQEFKSKGVYSVTFDGSALSSGVYLYQISSNNLRITKKLILIK
ncbi:MAG TPA: T9SS type A sorting domain-containing protein [Ignavibacteria bacterium]|nr:T9SS type A sorting domain-containing protein [Ignavibacteria bacterium]